LILAYLNGPSNMNEIRSASPLRLQNELGKSGLTSPNPIRTKILKCGIVFVITTALMLLSLVCLNDHFFKLQVFSFYLLFLFFCVAYLYANPSKNLLVYIVPFAIVYLELTTPILRSFLYVFRTLLPGALPEADATLLTAFIRRFFGTGLMEELIKAIPVLIGLLLTASYAKVHGPARRYIDLLRCSTPIEGMLMGISAGAGFVFVETLHQFIPDRMAYVADGDSFATGLAGLTQLFQEILRHCIGISWAGIFGYFIGLSAQYPRSAIKLVTIGWLLATVLHSLWNVSFYFGDLGFPVFLMKNGPPLLALAVCFIKAKRFDGRENNYQRMYQR
jgi:RsiW-degrading membrane proteinase PrsW (M82 family)